jgi:hypothetical protein
LTVSKTLVECCREPDVAVTVMVDVVGWRGGGVELVDDPLPHPESALKPIAAAAIATKIGHFRRFRQPMQHRTVASTALDENGIALRCNAAADVVVAMVSAVETAPRVGVTVAGEKLQVTPEGRPEQLNETAVSKPFAGVTEMEPVAL